MCSYIDHTIPCMLMPHPHPHIRQAISDSKKTKVSNIQSSQESLEDDNKEQAGHGDDVDSKSETEEEEEEEDDNEDEEPEVAQRLDNR